jgi:GNAT superfamily N-acetyltransferase
MNVREATAADEQTLLRFTREIFGENWDRPWQAPEVTPKLFENKLVLLAEDEDEPVGYAFGELDRHGYAHVNIVYVVPERRREGVTTALLTEFASRAREAGIGHLTLDVATDNVVGREAWRRLGFTEWAQRLLVPIERIEQHGAVGESYASLHVQTDKREAVEAAVAKYLPRFGGDDAVVAEPRNGWVAVYDELLDRDRRARDRLASELSNATAAVVCAIGVDDGAVVRYALFERGSIVDEYQSVPEHFGPLPPGDVIALGANPTVVSRLTGADPALVRAVARTAASPDELPPPDELLAQIADVLGLEGAGRPVG